MTLKFNFQILEIAFTRGCIIKIKYSGGVYDDSGSVYADNQEGI